MSETISTSTEDIEALAQAILDLENGQLEPVADSALAYDLSRHVKPYVDRLIALKEGSSLLEGIDDDGDEDQLKNKKNRRRRKNKRGAPEGPLPELDSLSPEEKARWIFMERFIPLEKHQEILGYPFAEESFSAYQQALNRTMDNLLVLVPAIEAAQNGDIEALQQIFASAVLVFRNPFLADDSGHPTTCTIETMRHKFPAYFYKRRKKPNWFERFPFYTAALEEPHWALCDTEPLNCTLRRPERKLAGYARHWGVSDEHARQKTAIEDIYDRIICGEALEENLFSGKYNACTSTFYHSKGKKGPGKMVYIVQKRRKIIINGSDGTPHWKASKRLWPVAYPALTFS